LSLLCWTAILIGLSHHFRSTQVKKGGLKPPSKKVKKESARHVIEDDDPPPEFKARQNEYTWLEDVRRHHFIEFRIRFLPQKLIQDLLFWENLCAVQNPRRCAVPVTEGPRPSEFAQGIQAPQIGIQDAGSGQDALRQEVVESPGARH
jgi:hypothetical protein